MITILSSEEDGFPPFGLAKLERCQHNREPFTTIFPNICHELWSAICIGNHMISSAIWNKCARVKRLTNVSAICGLWKICECSFIPKLHEKSCDHLLIICRQWFPSRSFFKFSWQFTCSAYNNSLVENDKLDMWPSTICIIIRSQQVQKCQSFSISNLCTVWDKLTWSQPIRMQKLLYAYY